MRKTIWSMLTLAAIMAGTVSALAEEAQTNPTNGDAKVEQRQKQRKDDFRTALEQKDYDRALAVLDDMIADDEVMDEERFMARYFKFRIFAEQKHDGAKACLIAEKISKLRPDDPNFLNGLAWTILDTPEIKDRDYAITLAIAERAAEVSGHENPSILDTLARAHHDMGNLDQAVEVQALAVKKSVENNRSEESTAKLKETLEKYKAERDKATEKAEN